MRPYTLDYVQRIFTDFHELAGDRAFADDKAIVGGLARLNGRPVMVIGHQKGRDTKERTLRNFGMPRPEGYRKAMRLMKLAERFGMPEPPSPITVQTTGTVRKVLEAKNIEQLNSTDSIESLL